MLPTATLTNGDAMDQYTCAVILVHRTPASGYKSRAPVSFVSHHHSSHHHGPHEGVPRRSSGRCSPEGAPPARGHREVAGEGHARPGHLFPSLSIPLYLPCSARPNEYPRVVQDRRQPPPPLLARGDLRGRTPTGRADVDARSRHQAALDAPLDGLTSPSPRRSSAVDHRRPQVSLRPAPTVSFPPASTRGRGEETSPTPPERACVHGPLGHVGHAGWPARGPLPSLSSFSLFPKATWK
jgi:hypothetical protein